MNTNKMVEEERIKSEASIFWSKIAEYLPKSLERSALGDEKIYTAFFQAYTEFRPVLLSLQKIRTLEEVENWANTYGGGVNVPKTLEDLLAKLTSLKQDSGEIKK